MLLKETHAYNNCFKLRSVAIKNFNINCLTYPADCRKITAVDSHNSIGIERKENNEKTDFRTKVFLSAIYFDVIS